MTEALFQALASGLSLWQSKEARKYVDKLIRLKRDYYEEYNQEISDDAVLDNLRFELRLLSEAFSSKVGAENTENK